MKLKFILLSALIALGSITLSGCSAEDTDPAADGTTTSTTTTAQNDLKTTKRRIV